MTRVLHIAVVDDEKDALELLADLSRDWARARGAAAEVARFSSADRFLFAQEDGTPADVLLLDIEMPGTTGMELARQLSERARRDGGRGPQVIFVTGIIDYVLDGYDVDAVSYLMKPVRREKLFSALDRAVERAGAAEPVLVVTAAGETCRVALSRVCYVEAAGHDALVTLSDGTRLRSTAGLTRLADELFRMSPLFVSCHRSYVVSLAHVARITRRDVTMDTGDVVPLARGRWDSLSQAWLAWCRGSVGA